MSVEKKTKIFQFVGSLSSPRIYSELTAGKFLPCSEFRQYIDDRLDDQLPRELRAGMELHLEDCAGCRSRVREAQAMREMLSDMPVPEPTAGFIVRMLQTSAEVHSNNSSHYHKRGFFSGFITALLVTLGTWFVLRIINL